MFLIFPIPTCLVMVLSDTKWLLGLLYVSHAALYCLVLGLGILISFLVDADNLWGNFVKMLLINFKFSYMNIPIFLKIEL